MEQTNLWNKIIIYEDIAFYANFFLAFTVTLSEYLYKKCAI